MPHNNLIFISGPHGAGKTTLIKKLSKYPNIQSLQLETRTKEFYWGDAYQEEKINHFHRQSLKIAQRTLENEELVARSRQNKSIILGDRCIYDDITYSKAFLQLNWITKNEYNQLSLIRKIQYRKELQQPNAIILNIPYQECQKHLEIRRKKGEREKFKSRDPNFLRTVCKCFEELQSNPNILYINQKINNQNIETIYNWIISKYSNQSQK